MNKHRRAGPAKDPRYFPPYTMRRPLPLPFEREQTLEAMASMVAAASLRKAEAEYRRVLAERANERRHAKLEALRAKQNKLLAEWRSDRGEFKDRYRLLVEDINEEILSLS